MARLSNRSAVADIASSDRIAAVRPVSSQPTARGPAWNGLEAVDLKAFLNILKRRRGVILGCAALLISIATLIVFQLTPIYTAEAVVMLDTRKSQVVDLQAVMSGIQSDEAAVRSEVEVLKSRALASRVVDKLDLMADPQLNPALAPATFWQEANPAHLLQQLFSSKVTPIEDEATVAQRRERAHDAVIDRVMNDLTVFNDGRSYVIKIRYQAQNPELAAKIANTFADEYLLAQLDAKFEATKRATDWLNEHLTDLRAKAQQSDQAVQLYMTQHNLVGTKNETVTMQQLSELNSQLIIATADRTQKEANLRQIQALANSGNAESAAQVLASPVIQQLKAQETALMQKQAELATRYRPEHPEMINLQAQIKDIKSKIQTEIANITRSMSNDVQAARAREAALSGSIHKLQQEADVQDAAGVGLRELQREADANRTLYENFLNRFKQTSAQEDIQQADARLVSAAAVPIVPTFPRKSLFISVAVFLSIAAGLAVAFLLEHLDNGFRTSEQIERTAGIPFFGYVPAIAAGTPPHQVTVQQPLCAYAESIRSIRTALRFSNVDDPPKVVLVTSSVPNEGKTTFSASLAQSVARSGGRAILIDCDLRHPSVGKLFEAPKGPGLLSFFKGRSDMARLVQIDMQSRLHYVTAEEGTVNPQDLLGSQHMRDALASLRNNYDLIILDAPPVLAVSDSIVLSHLVDAVVFVVRWEKTPRQVALGAIKLLQTQGANLAGAVLSRVNVRSHAKYGYGDSGYYYGRYGAYYGSAKVSEDPI